MHARNPTAFSARAGNLLHNRKGSGSLLISIVWGVTEDFEDFVGCISGDFGNGFNGKTCFVAPYDNFGYTFRQAFCPSSRPAP
jgi:hypothetical protein